MAPRDTAWALVRVTREPASPTNGLRIETANAIVIQAANTAADIDSAVAEATAWAKAKGAPVVYVKRHPAAA
jgi:hypothetical protein